VITYKARSAIRDVGKALGMSLAQVDRLAKNVYWWDGRRLNPERVKEAGFDPENPTVRRLVKLVGALVGFPRHLSQHVGGFVISRGPLERLVPIENAAMPGRTVIQWDKNDLDALGLLKVDCLCLGMLTAIHKAFDAIRECSGKTWSMASMPPEDPETYAMIQRADTMGVFQIESRAQMAMLPRPAPPALRLGLRLVKGLSHAGSKRLLEARAQAVFADVADLARRARLDRKDLECLAGADALQGLAGNRYQAHWEVLGVEEPLPVLADAGIREALSMLRPPTEGDNIVKDYACIGLTLRRHPLALLRPHLESLDLRTADRIRSLPHGQAVRTGGLVINRQRPGTATGVVFLTLEDETGYINVVVWNRLVERQRHILLGARLLGVVGEVQREDEVVHVIARHLEDHSSLLGRLASRSRDFH